MQVPSQNQINTAFRYAGSAVAWAGGAFVFLGVLSPDQSSALIADMHQITDGLQQAIGGVSKAVVVIGPVIGIYLAKVGYSSGNLPNILKTLTSQHPEAQIQGQIVVPADVAAAVPSAQVVSK